MTEERRQLGDDDGDYDDGTNDRATGELAGREDIYR